MINTTNIPNYVITALNMLDESGFKAYLVGGCVRDSILGQTPGDWDITTDASPERIMEIFPHSIPTGIQHGTITVVFPEKNIIEVTTFRIDGEYKDSRHPSEVFFSKNIQDDLSRRDFTMNAMAYSQVSGFVDPFNGINDIMDKIIRCVGNPHKRFTEDALRMMRSIRFSAVLGFDLDKDLLASVIELNYLLKNISIERIRDEFTKTLLSSNANKISLFRELGLMIHFLPELTAIDDDIFYEKMKYINILPFFVSARMAYLFHDICPESILSIMKRMRYDNSISSKTLSTVNCLNLPVPETGPETRQMMADKGLRCGLSDSLRIRLDTTAKYRHSQILNAIYEYEKALALNYCTDISMLEINGYILDQLGIKDGKTKGTILKHLLKEVLIDPSLNIREKLIEIAEGMR